MMPTQKPVVTVVVEEDTKYLVGLLAAFSGKSESALVNELILQLIDAEMTPEDKEMYLKRRRKGDQSPPKQAA